MFGKITKPENENLKDLNLREKLVLIPLMIAIFWIGIYPKPFFSRMEPSVKALIENAQTKYGENQSFQESLTLDSQQIELIKQME
jgi:NADH-quinone oxidoreductase subunit M